MKVDYKKYAQLLMEITSVVSGEELDLVLEKFMNLLKKRGDLHLFKEIISEFRRLYNKKENVVVAEVTFAHDIDEQYLDEIERFLSKELETKDIEIAKKIDKKLLGGLKIQVEDMVLDATLKTKIKRLKQGFLIK